MKTTTDEIDKYIAGFSAEVQKPLNQLRSAIRKVASEAAEAFSYGVPAFKWNGVVVCYAAHSKHIGFYPGPSGIEYFKKELKDYKTSKGAIQFPLDKPLPLDLLTCPPYNFTFCNVLKINKLILKFLIFADLMCQRCIKSGKLNILQNLFRYRFIQL